MIGLTVSLVWRFHCTGYTFWEEVAACPEGLEVPSNQITYDLYLQNTVSTSQFRLECFCVSASTSTTYLRGVRVQIVYAHKQRVHSFVEPLSQVFVHQVCERVTCRGPTVT